MDAAKLKNNKQPSKTKLKKTIKNVVCRPDRVTWILASDIEQQKLDTLLQNYRINLPIFKKPHWNEIKSIPKEKRPKPPPIKKVSGLLFGINECQYLIQTGICCGILVELDIKPKLLVESIIEDCFSKSIPHICVKGLRNMCANYFGIPTSCLGIKKDSLPDVFNAIQDIYKRKQPEQQQVQSCIKSPEIIEHMDVDKKIEIVNYPYLIRKDKRTRVFSPGEKTTANVGNKSKFMGQNFIELPITNKPDRKSYMNMIVKRISSNPNRAKLKK